LGSTWRCLDANHEYENAVLSCLEVSKEVSETPILFGKLGQAFTAIDDVDLALKAFNMLTPDEYSRRKRFAPSSDLEPREQGIK